MGKGGESALAPPPQLVSHWTSPYNPLDPKAPKLPTKGEIKAVIPKECFERSYLKGLAWIMFDVGLVALLAFTAQESSFLLHPLQFFSALEASLGSLDGLCMHVAWDQPVLVCGCLPMSVVMGPSFPQRNGMISLALPSTKQ